MTKSGSNSEGSGPFPAGAALLLSPSLGLAGRLEGDRLRELERRAVVELDREGVACWVAFWRACSSAILASMAPRMRCVPRQLNDAAQTDTCVYLEHDEVLLWRGIIRHVDRYIQLAVWFDVDAELWGHYPDTFWGVSELG
jgi:hypothetical protein